jgi:hypothetical protein
VPPRSRDSAPDWLTYSPESPAPGSPGVESANRHSVPVFLTNLALVEGLRVLAREQGATVAALAAAWVLSRGDDSVPLVGARRPAVCVLLRRLSGRRPALAVYLKRLGRRRSRGRRAALVEVAGASSITSAASGPPNDLTFRQIILGVSKSSR